MKKISIVLVAVVLLLQVCFAADASVEVDGTSFEGGKLIGSVTYVPIRAFCELFYDCEVSWDNSDMKARVVAEDADVSARIGDKYIESRERILYSGNTNIIVDGSTYVPIRSISKAIGASVSWDDSTRTARVSSGAEEFKSADEFYNANDLYWLAKIISAESSGESLDGKIAVGNVVLNRVESDEFPNNVYDVIFDKKGGVQFTPVANGSINKYPTEESFVAAKICLEDYKLTTRDILFFLNPSISTSAWVPNNRDFVMTIGRHDFYA